MTKPPQPPYLGAAYYPEAWPLEQIDADIELMLQAGMNVMRVGEFAWARLEPEEGRYDFDWLHLAVEKLGQAGIATILGTPTPTPPVCAPSMARVPTPARTIPCIASSAPALSPAWRRNSGATRTSSAGRWITKSMRPTAAAPCVCANSGSGCAHGTTASARSIRCGA